MGEISDPSQIAYNPSHEYHLVISVPTTPSSLAFGVSDGVFADNGGAYQIQLLQLQPQAVPEPGTLALFGLGIAGIGALAARRRRG